MLPWHLSFCGEKQQQKHQKKHLFLPILTAAWEILTSEKLNITGLSLVNLSQALPSATALGEA